LFGVRPQPEMFELNQALAIPIADIERRHEYMLSVVRDRIENRDRYKKEYLEKYSNWFYVRLKTKDIIFGDYMPHLNRNHIACKMAGCSHEDVPWIRDTLWEKDSGEPKGFSIFMRRPYIKKWEKKKL